jgi:tryptophan synthase beta chain
MPYILDKINGKNLEIIAAEPTSCPTLTRGLFAYDFGDAVKSTPLLPMHTLGHDFVPAPIHAGGLRYHGIAPIVSQCVVDNLVTPRAYVQNDIFAAGILFARTEGHIPAPETNHAIAAVVEAARKAKEEGKEKVILFNFSGHGLLDLPAYDAYLSGRLTNYELPDEEIQRALKAIENLPKP